jgi:hypothetical protein
VTGAVLAGLVAAAVTVGGASCLQPPEAPAEHPVPAASPQVSPDHPALTTVWRPR